MRCASVLPRASFGWNRRCPRLASESLPRLRNMSSCGQVPGQSLPLRCSNNGKRVPELGNENSPPLQWREGINRSVPSRRDGGNRCQGSVSVLLLIQLVDFLFQAGIAAYQCDEISNVDRPSRSVGCIKKVHRTLLLGSSRASRANVSSTSRCNRSSRSRDQHTRNAKHQYASQLIN